MLPSDPLHVPVEPIPRYCTKCGRQLKSNTKKPSYNYYLSCPKALSFWSTLFGNGLSHDDILIALRTKGYDPYTGRKI